MRTVLNLVWKDVLLFSKDKVAVGLTFVVPVALIYIFGQVFGVNRTSSGPTGIPLAIVNESDAPEITTLIAALKREPAFRVVEQARAQRDVPAAPLSEAIVREEFRSNRYRFALIFPADAMAGDAPGLRLKFLYNPRNDIETQTVTGLLQRTIFTEAPSLLLQSLRKQAVAYIGPEATDRFYDQMAEAISRAFGRDREEVREAMRRDAIPVPVPGTGAGTSATGEGSAGGFIDRLIRLEKEQLGGEQVKNPMATRSVGGWAMMFLMFSLSASAAALFDEKKAGLFLRLLAGPVTRAHVLWSKYVFGIALGLVQLLTLFLAGRVLFDIDITSNFGNLVLACLSAAMCCTAFGMLLASVARTPAAASGLATFLILTMSAMGGAWFPLSLMPEFMQTLGKFTITYWAMEGFTAALWAGASFREMLPWCGTQLAIAAGIMAISLWRFRRGTIFV